MTERHAPSLLEADKAAVEFRKNVPENMQNAILELIERCKE
jgi:hypothetical protein